ncbi:MAG: hypothetical protein ABI573_11365 [Chloroflexota bacterium]
MGSGETAPTMAKVHRSLFDRLGPNPVAAAILDTPYGFQENADSLSARTVEFFGTSVGRAVDVASYRSRDVDGVTLATAVGRIRQSRYVMAGPGSPSYALRQWENGPIPGALADKMTLGGILTMASAAALTLGVVTIPVYEIYKVGEEPRWLEGLDLLGAATGLQAAVVPHYDNAEGGNHDTRFCYLGERRLRMLERTLPDGAFILGVDSHTALVMDLDRNVASVAGLGGVTIRSAGDATFLPSGSELPIQGLGEIAADLAAGRTVAIGWEAPDRGADPGSGSRAFGRARSTAGGVADSDAARQPLALREAAAEHEGAFLDALGRGDTRSAVAALLEFDDAIAARLRAGEDSPDLDNAMSTFRSLLARLGEAAEDGVRDPSSIIDPFVSTLIELRARARSGGDYATADLVRDRLSASGVEVRDDAGASTWVRQDR